LNNDDRKLELTEILCTALADFAALVLVQYDLDEVYDRHDLVADLLLCHHSSLLSLLRLNLHFLLERYKLKHKCGRPLSLKKNAEALYNLLWPSVAGKKADSDTAAPSPAAAAASVTPASSLPVNRVLQLTPPAASENPADTNDATKQSAPNSKDLPSPYRKATQVLQDALTEAMTALTSVAATGAKSKDSVVTNTNGSAEFDASTLSTFDSGATDAELVHLLEQVDLKNSRLKDCRDMVEIDSIRSKSRLAIPPLLKPDECPPPSFQAQVDKPADATVATPAENSAPKEPTADSTASNIAAPHPEPAAPVQVLTTNPQPIAAPEVDTTVAVSTLWKALNHCFVEAPSAYLTQHSYNIAANKMSRISASKLKTASANKTLEILASEGDPSLSDPPSRTVDTTIDQKVRRANDETKRKLQSSTDTLLSKIETLKKVNAAESAKRRKLEATVNELQRAKTSSEGNDEGGPATGAIQTNQMGKSKTRRSKKKKQAAASPPTADTATPLQKSNSRRRRGKNKQSEAAGAVNASNDDSQAQHQQNSQQRSVLKKNLTWRRSDPAQH
jgi:hypothetical protein